MFLTSMFALALGTTFTGQQYNEVFADSYDGKTAFEGPFFYIGPTTYEYRYFETNANQVSNNASKSTINIDDSKTITVTEDQILTYWLHTPIHYDSSRQYPVLVYCPGSGCTIFDHEGYSTTVNLLDGNSFQNGPYAGIQHKYLQSTVYKTFGYGQDSTGLQYIYSNGEWNTNADIGEYNYGSGTSVAGGGQLVDHWYDLVYNQGKEEYDCFLIYIQPGDEVWWENTKNLKLLNIHTMSQAIGIDGITTTAGAAFGSYGSTYVASELSPNIYSQLLVQLIDSLSNKYSIDLQRQYLSGYSLGAQFSYDTICHYPDRFSAMCITGLPASDLTLENAKKLTNANMWIVGGSSDINPSFTQLFIEKMLEAKDEFGGTGTAQYSKFTGGHSGVYLSSKYASIASTNPGYASCQADSTDIIDFMFNSVRTDMDTKQYNHDLKTLNNCKPNAVICSEAKSNDCYDLALFSIAPLGEYDECGFLLTTSENVAVGKNTAVLKANNRVRNESFNLGNDIINVNAVDHKGAFLYSYVIKDIPKEITQFKVRTYATNNLGTKYGDLYNINISLNDDKLSLEVTK